MRINAWLIFGIMLSASALARQATTNAPAAAGSTNAVAASSAPSAGTTNAATKAGKKKKSAAKKRPTKPKAAAAELKTVPLTPGPASVQASNVNVRAKASLKSEVVGRVSKGQQVIVIEEVVKNNSGPNEPSAWAKITLPSSAKAWVNNAFVTNDVVMPKKLNVRSGPSENYSVVGTLEHGAAIKELGTKGDWIQIEPPTNAWGFVAAQFLSQAPVNLAASAPEPPAPGTNMVAEAPTIAPTTIEAPDTNAPPPATAETPGVTNMLAQTATSTNATEAAPEEPPPPRIVQHEGFVRGWTSIQAPSPFALVSPENGRVIDYLYNPSRELDLRRYKGLRIVVTGEEALDERWGSTPVLTIQKLQIVDEGP